MKNLHGFLRSTYGLRNEDTRILTDDPSYSEAPPTKANILYALRWLVQDVRPGDSLFLHYSGEARGRQGGRGRAGAGWVGGC